MEINMRGIDESRHSLVANEKHENNETLSRMVFPPVTFDIQTKVTNYSASDSSSFLKYNKLSNLFYSYLAGLAVQLFR